MELLAKEAHFLLLASLLSTPGESPHSSTNRGEAPSGCRIGVLQIRLNLGDEVKAFP